MDGIRLGWRTDRRAAELNVWYNIFEWSPWPKSEYARLSEVLSKLSSSAQIVDLEVAKFEASASTGVGWLSLTVRDFSLLVRSGRAPLFVRADGSATPGRGAGSFLNNEHANCLGVEICSYVQCSRLSSFTDDRCGVDLMCCATDCR